VKEYISFVLKCCVLTEMSVGKAIVIVAGVILQVY